MSNDEKTKLQSIAMREWLEKIYAQQGWSDLGEFLKSQEFEVPEQYIEEGVYDE